jgi:hypothetical protein
MNPPDTADQFLSEDDLDLRNLSWEELLGQWDAWLRAASVTDEEDAREYEHGVFQRLREQP